MAGQGASLAMTGAYVLADALRAGGTVPAALPATSTGCAHLARRTTRSGRRIAAWEVPTARWRLAVRTAVRGLLAFPGAGALLRAALTPRAGTVVLSTSERQPRTAP